MLTNFHIPYLHSSFVTNLVIIQIIYSYNYFNTIVSISAKGNSLPAKPK